MKTFYGLKGLDPAQFNRPVLTLGTFDGVHLGHQAVLDLVVRQAAQKSGESVVLTFERHPREVLCGVRPNPITSLRHRLSLIRAARIDTCVVMHFNRKVSQMDASEFLGLLSGAIGIAEIVVGPDTTFGRGCEGDVDFLKGVSARFGFQVSSAQPVQFQEEPISSSRIREAILAGHIEDVSAMLGRTFSVFGTVVRGDGRGRRLGYPTANLDLHGEVVPPPGVYATLARVQDRSVPSVTSIGQRPTFGDGLPVTVESFLLDFDGDLYGADLELVFVERLREERRFSSREELKAAIDRDVKRARPLLTGA